MEQFVREYVARSMLPHLTATEAHTQLDKDITSSSSSSSSSSSISSSNSNSIADIDINSSKLYFIAQQQQLLNNSDYLQDNDAFTAAVETYKTTYNDTSTVLMLTNAASNAIDNFTNSALAVAGAEVARHYGAFANEAYIGNDTFLRGYNDYLNFSCDGDTLSDVNVTSESPLSSVYFKTAVYLLYIPIFVFALLGNGLVCYIVQSTPRMRTVTNFFIANLAVGDILMSLFCVPFSFVSIFILGYWPFGIALCYLVNYSQAVSVLVSAYTLVAISIDRYIAIMWPLRPRITKRYAKFIIAGVWGIALATAFPIPIVSKLMQPDVWHVHCNRYICREEWPSMEQSYYYTLALFTLQFVVPLAVLIFTYTRIALAVWGKRPPGEAENSRDQRMARSKRKMIKMMVMVVIVFTICWLPFNILVLLLNDNEFSMWEPLPYFWFAFHWLAMSHSCYNPIIYCYMNARFRSGFLQIVYRVPGLRRCCCIRRCLRTRGDRSYEATGEMTFKFIADNAGGLLRKPKIRIRNRRCIPPAKSEHMHHLHQHTTKTAGEFYAGESIFMCGNHSIAVVPAQ